MGYDVRHYCPHFVNPSTNCTDAIENIAPNGRFSTTIKFWNINCRGKR